mgnify:CR=1 FL=1
MKTIVIGVMPQEQIRARAIAIAKGEYKPKPGEPKIWFTSMKSVAEVLSDYPDLPLVSYMPPLSWLDEDQQMPYLDKLVSRIFSNAENFAMAMIAGLDWSDNSRAALSSTCTQENSVDIDSTKRFE